MNSCTYVNRGSTILIKCVEMADHKTQGGIRIREYEHHRDRAMMHEDRSEIVLELTR
jgi:hypothetical protein